MPALPDIPSGMPPIPPVDWTGVGPCRIASASGGQVSVLPVTEGWVLTSLPEYSWRKAETALASGPTTMLAGMIAPEKPPFWMAYMTAP